MIKEKISDVIKHIKVHQLDKENRKVEIIDRRNYLIGYLYHYFSLSEEDIAKFFNKHRCTINFHKNKIYDLMNDEIFLRNTLIERQLFPLTQETLDVILTIKKRTKINNGVFSIKLDKEEIIKLNDFIVSNNIRNFDEIVPKLINKFL